MRGDFQHPAHRGLGVAPAGGRLDAFEERFSKLFDEVVYWAPLQARQVEVDFLLRRGREYLALEVKAQARFSTSQLSGLRAIADLPRLARRVLVYLGERRLRTGDGIEVWPLRYLLARLAEKRLWP